MHTADTLLGRTLISGTIAGVTTALAAAIAGKREADAYAAPLNATSHIVWGDRAAQQDQATWKYTAIGFLLNHAATTMWAGIYEKWFAPSTDAGNGPKSVVTPLAGAAAVAAGAYVTDYYLVPKRVTPGFEMRLSGKSLALIFGAMAIGIAARSLIDAVE